MFRGIDKNVNDLIDELSSLTSDYAEFEEASWELLSNGGFPAVTIGYDCDSWCSEHELYDYGYHPMNAGLYPLKDLQEIVKDGWNKIVKYMIDKYNVDPNKDYMIIVDDFPGEEWFVYDFYNDKEKACEDLEELEY